jgi:rubrerythrin
MTSTDLLSPRAQLIATLQMAYSGELAAGYAYRGHWHSVSDEEERRRIKQIEDEEWHHRKLVGEMLESLGSGPIKGREIRATVVGRVLGLLCHVTVGLRRCTGRANSRVAISSSMRRRRVMRSRAGVRI